MKSWVRHIIKTAITFLISIWVDQHYAHINESLYCLVNWSQLCSSKDTVYTKLQWRHYERDGVSNQRRLDGLLNCLFRRKSKKALKLCVTGLCEGNSPVTGEIPAQRASKNASIWWRHQQTTWRALNKSIGTTNLQLCPLSNTENWFEASIRTLIWSFALNWSTWGLRVNLC